jgi:hypothetical protein
MEASMSRTSSLVSLATQMGLSPIEAVALPAVIESASRKSNMAESAMIWEAQRNAPLREYLSGICRRTDVLEALS